jgi:hypothetical protein
MTFSLFVVTARIRREEGLRNAWSINRRGSYTNSGTILNIEQGITNAELIRRSSFIIARSTGFSRTGLFDIDLIDTLT